MAKSHTPDELIPPFKGKDGDASALSSYLIEAVALCQDERKTTTQADWDEVYLQIASGLEELCQFPVIQQDPVATQLVQRLLSSKDIEEFIGRYDQIAARCALILEVHEAESKRVHHMEQQSRARKTAATSRRSRLIL